MLQIPRIRFIHLHSSSSKGKTNHLCPTTKVMCPNNNFSKVTNLQQNHHQDSNLNTLRLLRHQTMT